MRLEREEPRGFLQDLKYLFGPSMRGAGIYQLDTSTWTKVSRIL